MQFVSLCCPPGRQPEVIDQAQVYLKHEGIPLFMAGDLNLQLASPREGERTITEKINDWLAREGSSPIHYQGNSFAGNHGTSQIDFVACPHRLGIYAQVRREWRRSLSDHAALCTQIAKGDGSGRNVRPLNPTSLKSLPPAAFDSLRRRFAVLETTFQVPAVNLQDVIPRKDTRSQNTGNLGQPPARTLIRRPLTSVR